MYANYVDCSIQERFPGKALITTRVHLSSDASFRKMRKGTGKKSFLYTILWKTWNKAQHIEHQSKDLTNSDLFIPLREEFYSDFPGSFSRLMQFKDDISSWSSPLMKINSTDYDRFLKSLRKTFCWVFHFHILCQDFYRYVFFLIIIIWYSFYTSAIIWFGRPVYTQTSKHCLILSC